MSASNEYWTWHLTPEGWVEGTEKLDCGTTERPVPADTVLTLTYHERLSLGYSQLERWIDREVTNGKQTEIDGLKRKYGNMPKEMNYFKITRN